LDSVGRRNGDESAVTGYGFQGNGGGA